MKPLRIVGTAATDLKTGIMKHACSYWSACERMTTAWAIVARDAHPASVPSRRNSPRSALVGSAAHPNLGLGCPCWGDLAGDRY